MKQKVLFLCTGNSCRSQMAEGWLRHLAGDQFDVVSAGTHPVGLNPYAVAVMGEIGVDISNHVSERVDPYLEQQFDHVITVCDRAQEACPSFPMLPQCCIGVSRTRPRRRARTNNKSLSFGKSAMTSLTRFADLSPAKRRSCRETFSYPYWG